MLPSSKRLTTPLFKSVIDKGKVFHSALFLTRLLKTKGLSRFSVVVSKKVAKTAVERNKLRRRTYSQLSILHPRLKPEIHGVFMAKLSLIKAPITEIKADLENFFVKTGLLK